MTRYCWLPVSACMAVFLLSACATPELPDAMPEAQRSALLEAMNHFQVRGGLGIWTDEQSYSARIDWQEKDDELVVRLSGPLGIGDVRLLSGAELAIVTRGGAEISRGPLVDSVLQDALGLSAPVPMQQLKYWIRGLPGNAKSVVKDTQGKLSSLRYQDSLGTWWQVRFLRYTHVDRLALPALIMATGGPYSVRLRLKDWQYPDESAVNEKTQSNTRLVIPQR